MIRNRWYATLYYNTWKNNIYLFRLYDHIIKTYKVGTVYPRFTFEEIEAQVRLLTSQDNFKNCLIQDLNQFGSRVYTLGENIINLL